MMSKLAFFLIMLFCTNTLAAEISHKLTEPEAAKLAAMANEGSTKFWKSYDLDDTKTVSPGFFAYDELGLNGDSLGFFAVNPWTGDVWKLFGCRKVGTPASRDFQARIRNRFKPEELKLYEHLSNLKPNCM